ncbi:hypothetical protein BGW39_007693 [Mortierella sp. 14UC]|nr:hypothetical protein BGW39_007693 [Mortierella sp. 14UC]
MSVPTTTTATPATATPRNPFDLPELRHRLSCFVALEDALSCMLVCKAWTDDFMSAIWFEIDFNVHPRFASLSPNIIAKHGRHIRTVKNAKSLPQVSVLANASVCEVRDLHIDPAGSVMQYVRAYEVVHRNNTSLEDLHLFATSHPPNKHDSFAHYVSAPALAPSSSSSLMSPSKLKMLRIQNMCLTHDSLAAILQGCPRLSDLRLTYSDVIGSPTQSFQHMGIKILSSTLKSLFEVPSTGPSLLSYFPSLTTLCTFNYIPSATISSDRIKEEISRYCPNITGYRLEDSAGTIVPEFLNNIACNVSEIVFKHEDISLEMIIAILLHQISLKSVWHFNVKASLDFEAEEVAPVSAHFQASGRYLQLIPRCCSKLDSLNLHFHEMKMDDIEMGEWVCKDLTTLKIRIKDLDTKEKILRTIALWRKGCWSRWQEKAGDPVETEMQEQIDMSIEARVARHLLKFDKLWTVWLGYQTWTPL